MEHRNKNVVLIGGAANTGKSASLWKLIEEQGDAVAYINTDGKTLPPFDKNKVAKFITPSDPLQVNVGVRKLEEDETIKWIVVDTLSFWFDQLELKHVINSEDSRGAWGKVYQAEIHDLLHFASSVSKKNWIFLTHTAQDDTPINFVKHTRAMVKGSTAKKGIESFFDLVIYTWNYETEDPANPVGYGFQVQRTKDTIGFGIRSPHGMFDKPYLKSNNILRIFKKIDEYYSTNHKIELLDPED